ncbi:MAG: hypothetical protein IJA75_03235 [Oscillospiraceae bacterium]|nr:hypothetical protein [Oscillospiraceae bacterium]
MDTQNASKSICHRSTVLLAVLILLLGFAGCGSPKVTNDADCPTVNIPEATRQRTEYTVPTVDNSWMTEGSSIYDLPKTTTYILNTNTDTFHRSSCSYADDISPEHREQTTKTRSDLIAGGYDPCGHCNP